MTLNKCTIFGVKYGDVIENGQEMDPYEEGCSFPKINLKREFTSDADPTYEFYDNRLVSAIHQAFHPNSAQSDYSVMLRHFFRSMALCSTVVPSRVEQPGEASVLHYQAQSPDENALLQAARSFGFVLHERDAESLTITEPGPNRVQSRMLKFPLLYLLDFDNVRKRMSVIVRDVDTGAIYLYCKGADSSLFPYAAPGQDNMMTQTTSHLHDFAAKGLRTLVFGMKELSEQQWNSWKERIDEAASSLDDREERVRECYNEIENNFIIMGASAIEDKLQDGVPLAIRQLLSAGIRMWVLTGDKQETAINIGYSCNLLGTDTNLTVINDDDAEVPGRVAAKLAQLHLEMEGKPYAPPPLSPADDSVWQRVKDSMPTWTDFETWLRLNFLGFWIDIFADFGLVKKTEEERKSDAGLNGGPIYALSITGNALDSILPHLNKKKKKDAAASTSQIDETDDEEADLIGASNLTDLFVKVAGGCSTVICCRMTPLAKARVVELFRRHLHARALSIGDGANDVPMIRCKASF